jgi:VanZ family protein
VSAGTLRAFRRPWLWLGAWAFGWLLCIVLSLVHAPSLNVDVPEGDKLEHMLAYGLLAAWAVWIFAGARTQRRAALALFALGVAMEIAQGTLTDYRSMDAWDALADGVGILAGWWLGARRVDVLQQLERMLLR